jgi:GTP cyclohydrolase I
VGRDANELEPQSLATSSLQELMKEMLVRVGEDPERNGLRYTPERRERSMQYLTRGYQENPEETLLGAMFDVAYDEMVIVKDIEMFSLCEHYLPPFFGKVHVGYIPQGKVIGLSKIPRLVDVIARRLRVEERLTTQIAEAIENAVKPQGAGVVV